MNIDSDNIDNTNAPLLMLHETRSDVLHHVATAIDDVRDGQVLRKIFDALGVTFHPNPDDDGKLRTVYTKGLKAHGLPEIVLTLMAADFTQNDVAGILAFIVSADIELVDGMSLDVTLAGGRNVTLGVDTEVGADVGEIYIVQDPRVPAALWQTSAVH